MGGRENERGRDGEEGEEESQNKKNYNFWSAAIGNRIERRKNK